MALEYDRQQGHVGLMYGRYYDIEVAESESISAT